MAEPIRVDIVSDVVCPWCVIGYHQLKKASEETGVEIEVWWHPFELNPNMPEEGQNLREHLAEKYGTTPEDSQKARARLTELGAELGFEFGYGDDTKMYNTFAAHQLIDWAAAQGRGHDMNMELMRAFFTRGEALNARAVLADAVEAVGLDPQSAMAALDAQTHAGEVREKEQFWGKQGVRGVPAMVFDTKHLVTGAQGESAYGRILQHLSAPPAD